MTLDASREKAINDELQLFALRTKQQIGAAIRWRLCGIGPDGLAWYVAYFMRQVEKVTKGEFGGMFDEDIVEVSEVEDWIFVMIHSGYAVE